MADKTIETWEEMLLEFHKEDGLSCEEFIRLDKLYGSGNKYFAETCEIKKKHLRALVARIHFFETEWVRTQSIIALMMHKLAEDEKNDS